jgi:NAD(P)-dependent dehydrogenase (short-subunit alcohol dehydrogenase family)
MDVVDVGRSRDAVDWAFVVDREPRRRCDRRYRRLERAVLESYIGETAREIFRMARVFVTGSADGLGKMAAELLIEQGHKVVLHARSAARAEETRKKVGGAENIVVGDLSNIAETKSVADQVNRLGRFDAVIHNAGIGYREPKLVKTVDDLPQLFAVNTLAPYLLTALITMPKRLVYLSSGMHYGAGSHLDDMLWEKRRWNGSQAYAETKFQDVLLAFAVARLFPEVKSNSLEPGWVPTKMGGAGAPDDIDKAHRTQVWLATSDEPAAAVSGRYFFHQKLRDPDPATRRRTTGSIARPVSEDFRHCFERAVTGGRSMSWYIDIDEGRLEDENLSPGCGLPPGPMSIRARLPYRDRIHGSHSRKASSSSGRRTANVIGVGAKSNE